MPDEVPTVNEDSELSEVVIPVYHTLINNMLALSTMSGLTHIEVCTLAIRAAIVIQLMGATGEFISQYPTDLKKELEAVMPRMINDAALLEYALMGRPAVVN